MMLPEQCSSFRFSHKTQKNHKGSGRAIFLSSRGPKDAENVTVWNYLFWQGKGIR